MSELLFTDLDGTLLFSRNSLPKQLSLDVCFQAETYSNGGHGYMEQALVDFFSEWSKTNLFIPVTTRSMEQFERLEPVFKKISAPFALASNGGNLYRFGKPDQEWNRRVVHEIADELARKEEILRIIRKSLPAETVRKIKEIDGLYFCVLVIERDWKDSFIQQINQELAVFGWVSYFQHKKIYFLPGKLTKEAAVKQLVKELSEEAAYLALGDTDMDQQMLLQSERHLYFGKETAPTDIFQTEYSLDRIKRLLFD